MIINITPEEIADAINLIFNDFVGDPMMKLYETSAQATLKFLRDESISLYCNGKKESYALTSFWREKNGTTGKDGESFWLKILSDGFGSFGALGNNFGKMTFTAQEKFLEGSPDEYLRIYKKLLKKTLIDSAVVLEYVTRSSEIFSNPSFATQALSWN